MDDLDGWRGVEGVFAAVFGTLSISAVLQKELGKCVEKGGRGYERCVDW